MIWEKIFCLIFLFVLYCPMAIADIPNNFDWGSYMTSVKKQWDCGSCWAFAAAAVAEAQYNIFWDWPDYDIDLSEENLITCGGGGDCSGGWPDLALRYIYLTGITDEVCFPYVDQNCPMTCGCTHGCSNAQCNDGCNQRYLRQWKLDGFANCGGSFESISSWIYNIGPVAVIMDANQNNRYWDGDVWRWDPVTDESLHAVTLCGWDETDDCWIAKNSWGPAWNGDGYFKLGFEDENIGDYGGCGALLVYPELHKFWAGDNAFFSEQGYLTLKGALDSGCDCSSPPSNSFIVKHQGNVVAYITSGGDMCIEGNLLLENETTPPVGDTFRIDYQNNTVCFIDSLGNLRLKHWIYQKP